MNTKSIENIAIYGGFGIFALLICIALLSALPFVVKGFKEPVWQIVWAQLALVFCYSFVVDS
jgi:hypothetical protein